MERIDWTDELVKFLFSGWSNADTDVISEAFGFAPLERWICWTIRFKYCSLLWRMSDLCDKAEEMCQFYNRSGPPSSLVNTRKHRSREINRETLLQTSPQKKEKNQRIPFTVTSHPQNLIVESSYETLLARVKHFQYHHCRDLMNTLIHVSDGLKQFQCKQFWQ